LPFPHVVVLEHKATPTGSLLKLKNIYLESLKRMLQEPSAALAGGITVGERRSLGEQLTEDFRSTGLIHIIVLSGYNIAIIVMAISALLSFLPHKIRYTTAILVIILFTILVGASATVVRAAIMGSIGANGAMAGRTYSALHALMFAGLAMLLWNPYTLIFDPSFQLSFIATLGLLFGVPLLVPYLTWIPNKLGMRELTAATIATQIAVYPLLLYMMGKVSLVSLPVNLLVLPIIPFAMLAVFLTGVFGSINFIVALPFAYLAQGALIYVFKVVEIFASLSFSTAAVPVFSFWWIAIAYVLLGLGVWYGKMKVPD
ncbi:MAG: ComEC/Rec2 family competence protein, partial [Candidatus Pacebacteria bacterium]|nr:ComEC/Rec2 family competence protein [Candidatus Paceibacterota bacterium]